MLLIVTLCVVSGRGSVGVVREVASQQDCSSNPRRELHAHFVVVCFIERKSLLPMEVLH